MNNCLKSQAAKELLIRRKARTDILHYVNAIDVPGKPVSDDDDNAVFLPIETSIADHHRLILSKLYQVSQTPHGRMMIFCPPGSAKSTYASVVFPSMYLGAAPNRRLILGTYGDSLAIKMGRRTRSIIKQPRYKGIFGCELTKESSAVQSFSLTNGSEYMAGGLLSGMTGNRANCLLPDTKIYTEQGFKTIEELFIISFSGNVLSYDNDKKRVVYRRVKALSRSEAKCFYRISTSNGNVVAVTGDHRVWTTKGWVEARFLAEGDCLLQSLQFRINTSSLCDSKSREKWIKSHLLQSFLSSKGSEFVARILRKNLQKMRETWGKAFKLVLFRRMQKFSKNREKIKSKVIVCDKRETLRNMQQNIQASYIKNTGEILLSRMQKSWSFYGNVREEKSRLEKWMFSCAFATTYSAVLQKGKSKDFIKRFKSMCDLSVKRIITSASHRFGRYKQQAFKFSDNVRDLSHKITRRGTLKTKSDYVVMVERICKPTFVYDIQVDKTECFFGNGILVHNCIIIDDPVKGREQANSLVIRDKTWDAYEEDLKTRLIPGGFIVIIQTRWHIDDLSGRILPDNWNGESGSVLCKDGNYWEVVCLQACCEVDNDPLGRKKGQYLWPEWFDTKHWEQFKSNPRMWQSLFQQLPTLTEGNFFKPDLIPIIQAEPSGLIKVRAWDFAATANDGDYTVGLLFGYNQQTKQGYILDIVRGQYAPEDVEKVLKNTADKDGRGVKILLPQDPGQAGKSQAKNFVKLLSGYTVTAATVSGDKETRASPVAAQINVGNISMLQAGWNREFIEELRNFPNGKNDDQVDTLSDGYNYFVNRKTTLF